MSKSEFLRVARARNMGLDLACYAARVAGVCRAQIDLWVRSV